MKTPPSTFQQVFERHTVYCMRPGREQKMGLGLGVWDNSETRLKDSFFIFHSFITLGCYFYSMTTNKLCNSIYRSLSRNKVQYYDYYPALGGSLAGLFRRSINTLNRML